MKRAGKKDKHQRDYREEEDSVDHVVLAQNRKSGNNEEKSEDLLKMISL